MLTLQISIIPAICLFVISVYWLLYDYRTADKHQITFLVKRDVVYVDGLRYAASDFELSSRVFKQVLDFSSLPYGSRLDFGDSNGRLEVREKGLLRVDNG